MSRKVQKHRKYSPQFKLCVILDIREHGLSYHEAVRKYWHTKTRRQEDNFRKQVSSWDRIYLEEGEQGLMKERRGRKNSGKTKEESNKPIENDLVAENQRLRMELEYLKKLSALVLAEEQEKNKKQ